MKYNSLRRMLLINLISINNKRIYNLKKKIDFIVTLCNYYNSLIIISNIFAKITIIIII